ncbi:MULTISPECIES: hypothetical protein [Klebsiella pneumoniae complex]|uniref:hypothetical protein n=1 Tax=Klebsiella pneumoniae complex TaxID=3390273 RepID=UPI00109D50E0|nr:MULTISPECIES: hypothetical protein [Klebsiella]HBZ8007603.1 hypothetical protein [Klebsiella variicola subsp. variicola]USB44709.1 hypothetical protein KU661_17685 [Klebsiella pneumoniae]VGQ02154.1 hypothetical protein SB5610_03475 [Klebsiella variicola]HBT4942907.1 hypothetical protein [Klebsiella pneumoniae]HBT4953887.1 hypothetical protein [Klebsiella pneumoniae]
MINNICINLFGSIDDICRRQLVNAGFRLPKETTDGYLPLLLNMKKRIIEPRKRTVHYHSTLNVPEKNRNGFNLLINKMRLGNNINSYQSHHLERTNFHDDFLNDFGLHHFHLGETTQKTGKHKNYIERTGNTVFAKVDQDDIYILGVFGHDSEERKFVYSDEKLLKSLYDEWPHLLEQCRVRGVTGQTLSPEERNALRSNGANVITALSDDIAIMAPGGGYMTNKMSAFVALELLRLYRTIPILKQSLFEVQEQNYPFDAYFKVITFGHNELSFFCDKNCFFTKIEALGANYKTISLAPGYGPVYSHGFVRGKVTKIYASLIEALNTTASRHYLHPFPSLYIRKV